MFSFNVVFVAINSLSQFVFHVDEIKNLVNPSWTVFFETIFSAFERVTNPDVLLTF